MTGRSLVVQWPGALDQVIGLDLVSVVWVFFTLPTTSILL